MKLSEFLHYWTTKNTPWIYKPLSDENYLKLAYKIKMGKPLNLKNPKLFNEKLQWLKINNRKDEYTMMVDKYAVREYIKEKIGQEHLIQLLGKWNSFDEIDFDTLPDEFVLKCNHNSHGLLICKDKSKIDFAKSKKMFDEGLSKNFYDMTKEWPYKNVKPCLIAEKLMEDEPGAKTLTDYKFFCFNGKADCVMICIGRDTADPQFYFFSKDWQLLRLNIRGKNAPEGFTVPKPSNIDEMFDIAEKLSQGIPHARIDLYSIEGKTYFGEITFFSDSGFDNKILPELDKRWGDMLDISSVERGNKR